MRLLSCALFALTATLVAHADDFKIEAGFTPLFNGKDLTGWKTKRSKDKPGDSLDGKTSAYDGRFVVKDGELVYDPKVKGDRYIETAKEYSGDVTVKFQFKPGEGCNNDLLFRGAKFDIKTPDIKELKSDTWYEMEVVLKGTKAEFKVNGQSIKTLDAKVEKGPFTLRAEFEAITVRRMRIKEGG